MSGELPRLIELKEFVDARGSELAALLNDAQTRGGERFARLVRSARRRATAHNRYSTNKRRPNVKLSKVVWEEDSRRPTNRAMRRRRAPPIPILPSDDKKVEQASYVMRRLETHAWHARRMKMGNRFGFSLPLHFFGRVKGSRAFLRRPLVIHDASYLSCLIIKGGWGGNAIAALRSCCLGLPDPPLRAIRGEIELDVVLASRPCSLSDIISPASALIVRGDVWLWLHPSALDEVTNALSGACKDQGCLLTLAPLRRIEVRGSASESTLLSIFNLASNGSEHSPSMTFWQTLQEERKGGGVKPWVWPPNSMLGLSSVVDPRLAEMKIGGIVFQGLTTLEGSSILKDESADERPQAGSESVSIWTRDAIDRLNLELSVTSSMDNCPTLPLAHPLPLSTDQVASVRRQWRKLLFSSGNDSKGTGDCSATSSSRSAFNFPVLIARKALSHDENSSRFDGYSLILPMGWVAPVWSALALKGARQAGLQEWRWLASGGSSTPIPCFPYDFPYTVSGASWSLEERRRNDMEAMRRPKGKARRVKDASVYIPWSSGIGREFECAMEADGQAVVSGKEETIDKLIFMPRPKGGEGLVQRGDEVSERWKGQVRMIQSPRQSWSDLCGISADPKSPPSIVVETRVERKMRRALERHLAKINNVEAGVKIDPPQEGSPWEGKDFNGINGCSHAYVSLRVSGKGKCESGAAVVLPTSTDSSSKDETSRRSVTVRVIGYVTSSVPRGGSKLGGLAICHIPSILKFTSQSLTNAEYAPPVKVWIKNPDSSVLRKATIKPLVHSNNSPLVTMQLNL